MRRATAYVLSLFVFASAAWIPTTIFAQTLPGSPFQGGSGGGGFTPGDSALFGDGTVTVPSIAWNSDNDGTGTGFYRRGANVFTFSSNGVASVELASTTLILPSTGTMLWTSGALGTGTGVQLGYGGATGALRILGGTTPTQSGTTCGTGPTIAGNNTNGSVILGTTPGLPCAIVFNGTWTAAPRCYLNPEVLTTATTTVRATTITTTGFVITSTAALVAADKVSWFCVSS